MTTAHWTRTRHAWLGCGVLLVAACAAPHKRTAPAPQPAIAVEHAEPVVAEPPPPAPEPVTEDLSPWPRLRARFAMPGCDYRPEVQKRARLYTKNPTTFADSWKRAMPFLLLVVDELERRDLPGEFAMLPYVESGYRPLPSEGDRPAGMWQLMPATARERGLHIGNRYDARLDAMESTTAALDLIERYDREFSDWRLANMAFNSGEFRVRQLLGKRDASELTADELAALAFSPGTHEHLDRLLALACIIDDPDRFSVSLPEPDPGDHLLQVPLEAGMDLRLAARLGGIPFDDLQRFNAGFQQPRMSTDARHRLLMPVTHAEAFRSAAESVPVEWWNDWSEQRARRETDVATWAAQLGVPSSVLALANDMDEDAKIAASTPLLLPIAEKSSGNTDPVPRASSLTHTIARGDTLSGIARRYGIPLQRLKHWNPQAQGVLRLGQRVRLRPAGA